MPLSFKQYFKIAQGMFLGGGMSKLFTGMQEMPAMPEMPEMPTFNGIKNAANNAVNNAVNGTNKKPNNTKPANTNNTMSRSLFETI